MNNNITENYVSHEVAKLLKEKGFDCTCSHKYCFTDKDEKYVGEIAATKLSDCDKEYRDGNVLAPSHALAIEWIRVNFGIWITVNAMVNVSKYYYEIKLDKRGSFGENENYNSPQEATEAALLYTIQKLIKDNQQAQ